LQTTFWGYIKCRKRYRYYFTLYWKRWLSSWRGLWHRGKRILCYRCSTNKV